MSELDLDDVDAERRAAVAIDKIIDDSRRWQQANRRPSALSAREGLAAAHFECMVIWMTWRNHRNGVAITELDSARADLAMWRVEAIFREVIG